MGGCSSVRDRRAVGLLGTGELLSCQEQERCFFVRNKKAVGLSGIRAVFDCQKQESCWPVKEGEGRLSVKKDSRWSIRSGKAAGVRDRTIVALSGTVKQLVC